VTAPACPDDQLATATGGAEVELRATATLGGQPVEVLVLGPAGAPPARTLVVDAGCVIVLDRPR
jgi:hypothetical protein